MTLGTHRPAPATTSAELTISLRANLLQMGSILVNGHLYSPETLCSASEAY
jgi:hypothetical protein